MIFVLTMLLFVVAPATERAALLVHAPDSPVRLERAVVLTAEEGPPLILYAARNTTDAPLDQFTVIAYVFREDGTLKARQMAPGRRSLQPNETKYSTLVLDGSNVVPSDIVVIGVNQAQRVNSDEWWRAELQRAAEAAVPLRKK
jgi:hypothetical protein